MDKIQAAIAKARAERQATLGNTSDPAPKAKPPETAPVPDTPQPEPSPVVPPRSDRAEVWKALPTFLPPSKQMERHRIVTFGGPKQKASSAAGAVVFDMLRTKVLQQMRANGWKRLAITSPGKESGKSTVTLNLAFSIAKRLDTYTLVTEMDMRRPSLARTLGIKGDASLASVLEGKADFGSLAMRPGPNLAFAVNHGLVRNPAELFQSPAIGPALAKIEAQYQPDLTIFDMPPMLLRDDAMAFMGQVDCVLLVAAAGVTTLSQIDTCERELATQTNVLGVVLNKCRYMSNEQAYGTY